MFKTQSTSVQGLAGELLQAPQQRGISLGRQTPAGSVAYIPPEGILYGPCAPEFGGYVPFRVER